LLSYEGCPFEALARGGQKIFTKVRNFLYSQGLLTLGFSIDILTLYGR